MIAAIQCSHPRSGFGVLFLVHAALDVAWSDLQALCYFVEHVSDSILVKVRRGTLSGSRANGSASTLAPFERLT